MRVVKQRENGIVRRVVLLDDGGDEVAPVNRFLSHLTDCRVGLGRRPGACAVLPRGHPEDHPSGAAVHS